LIITNSGPVLARLATDVMFSSRVRVAALNALAVLGDLKLEVALKMAQADTNEDLRKAATLLQARVRSPQAAENLKVTLENGTLGEKQAALVVLGGLQDPAADDVLARWLDYLMAGKVAKELQLDLLDAAAKRQST